MNWDGLQEKFNKAKEMYDDACDKFKQAYRPDSELANLSPKEIRVYRIGWRSMAREAQLDLGSFFASEINAGELDFPQRPISIVGNLSEHE